MLLRQAILVVVVYDVSLLTSCADGQLRRALGTLGLLHDLLSQLAVASRVAAIARQESYFGVMLHVLDWNETAIQFYKKMNATFLDDWKTICLKGDALRLVAESGDH
ncbi:MAG: hypothetical protein WB660_25295 [Candidatus Sulfotelmatobacter sp.]